MDVIGRVSGFLIKENEMRDPLDGLPTDGGTIRKLPSGVLRWIGREDVCEGGYVSGRDLVKVDCPNCIFFDDDARVCRYKEPSGGGFPKVKAGDYCRRFMPSRAELDRVENIIKSIKRDN